MSLYIRDQSTVPTEGWNYPGLAGYVISTRNYNIFYDEIVKHFTANGQPPPTQEEVIRFVCEHQSVPCIDGNQPLVNMWTLGIPATPKKGCC